MANAERDESLSEIVRRAEARAAMRPGYAEQDGCHNCGHVFRMVEFDEGDSFFCCHSAPSRPLCGSHAMGESHVLYSDGTMRTDEEHSALYDAWDEWSTGREVVPWGKCGAWEPQEVAGEVEVVDGEA